MELEKDMIVDLHIHTMASDGTWTPEQIVLEAIDKGVKLISITDHDETSNLKEAENQAKRYDIKFIKGVEISSTYNGELFHILGYGIDEQNIKLRDILKGNRKLLEDKDDNSIKALRERGYNIDFNEYVSYKHNPSRGGWKALNFLIDKNICKDVGDFFANLFVGENSLAFPQFPHPKEIVEIVKQAGGVPILAHPYYVHTEEKVEDRLSTFFDMGIEGFECYHPNHSQQITKECIEWCKRNNAIITAGSDCHGDFIKTRSVGKPRVCMEQLNLGKLVQFIE
ncbi:PHP domain-containing protein [Haloimpatiens sp. FM7330]|uniref:PHP domain-containing protein n=1 Tax=Haloimpatiens sp. FM7330 TaxID=3298610 RepID=UPI003625FEC4